jgi:Fic family protein
MGSEVRIPWREVDAPPHVNGTLQPLFKTVDALRKAWEDALSDATPAERDEARNRRLRRHAIETGIIERLYDVDWGVTEALVAEGLSSDVANRAGGLNDDTLRVIRSQYDALQYLTELVSGEDAKLTTRVIRELHILITRHQATYEARNQFGQIVHPPLNHGQWKQEPNHVQRPDDTIFEYAPPEQVQSQLELLIQLYNGADAHPIVLAAWLHHRFICIHPFEDGNGRVARALTLLVLLRAHYAPLVVDRRERDSYIAALDVANSGDLGDLIRFFGTLEIVALQSSLLQPILSTADTAVGVFEDRARRLRELKQASEAEKARSAAILAMDVHARISGYLDEQRNELRPVLRAIDPAARITVRTAVPPQTGATPSDNPARWWRRQLVSAARSIDFYANLAGGFWWTRLKLEALGVRLDYLAAVQKVGHGETGVLAVTVYAELTQPESDETATAVEPEPVLSLVPTDSVTLAYTEDAAERWPEIEALIRRTLRDAANRFADRLG